MKKWVLLTLALLSLAACGKNKDSGDGIDIPDPNGLGLFALPSGPVSDRFSIKGLWESDRNYENNNSNDYSIMRADIRSNIVTTTVNCFYDGENLYATTSSRAEEESPGVIVIQENTEKTVKGSTGRECTAYASKGRISDNRIRPDGTFGDAGGTFRKINN